MFGRREFWCAAFALGLVTPALAAPTINATVSHLCCGMCERALKQNAATIGWAQPAVTNQTAKSVTVTAKDGMEVDCMAFYNALQSGGFPAIALQVTGAKTLKMDVGHLCCGGCVGPLQAALKGVSWVESADVKANSPVMLTAKAGAAINLSELLAALVKAGYTAKSLIITG
jgi:hypothetical protein